MGRRRYEYLPPEHDRGQRGRRWGALDRIGTLTRNLGLLEKFATGFGDAMTVEPESALLSLTYIKVHKTWTDWREGREEARAQTVHRGSPIERGNRLRTPLISTTRSRRAHHRVNSVTSTSTRPLPESTSTLADVHTGRPDVDASRGQ